jgi:hypothetical protein
MEFPIKKWAVGVLSVIAVCLCVFISWGYVDSYLEKEKRASSAYQQIQEANKHFTEEPQETKEIFNDVRGRVVTSFYGSDGCIAVARYAPKALKAYSLHWIFDKKQAGESPGSINGSNKSSSTWGYAFGGQAKDPCSGVCLEPHPKMERREWWGDPSGECWISYWVEWEDGCRAYQWYNSCYKIWDEVIYWDCCVHEEEDDR